MIGIKRIASYVPNTVQLASELAVELGENADFPSLRLGTERLPRLNSGEDTSDLAARAVRFLLEQESLSLCEIDCLVVCTQNPDGSGLPHTSAIVQQKAGLSDSCACFDISLGCSGFVYGLNVVKGFMEAAGLEKGILVTADPYSKALDMSDKNTAMLFGDAATATLLSDDAVLDIGESVYSTSGTGAKYLEKTDKIFMNGRQIFNFVQKHVPLQIKELLEKAGLNNGDVDQFILHQASKHMVSTLVQRLELDEEKVPFDICDTGNTVSSSIPLILRKFIERPETKLILISGFGVGLSSGSMILKRRD